jgi:hypothetical protein
MITVAKKLTESANPGRLEGKKSAVNLGNRRRRRKRRREQSCRKTAQIGCKHWEICSKLGK